MPTLLIGIYAVTFALVIAVPLAVWSAYRRDRPFDRAGSIASFGFVAVPQIVLGVVLVFIFVSSWGGSRASTRRSIRGTTRGSTSGTSSCRR
jgi:ABC-type dipeptide/oligopeptide/nickel transport system permease component